MHVPEEVADIMTVKNTYNIWGILDQVARMKDIDPNMREEAIKLATLFEPIANKLEIACIQDMIEEAVIVNKLKKAH